MPNRRETWQYIALELGKLHACLLLAAHSKHSHRAVLMSRAQGVAAAARVVCRAFRSRSARFDERRFMRAFAAAK
jgi:hypothetical protein